MDIRAEKLRQSQDVIEALLDWPWCTRCHKVRVRPDPPERNCKSCARWVSETIEWYVKQMEAALGKERPRRARVAEFRVRIEYESV